MEEVNHHWARITWGPEAEATLGPVIAEMRGEYLPEIEAGEALLFKVRGPGYAGYVLLRFEQRRIDGELVCHVLASAGRGMRAAMVGMRKFAKMGGASELKIETHSEALMRVHRAAGFALDHYVMTAKV